MTSPSRPDQVPPQASLDAEQQVRVARVQTADGPQEHRWRADGTFLGWVQLLDGRRHGRGEDFYPDGEVCARWVYEHGRPVLDEAVRHPRGAAEDRLRGYPDPVVVVRREYRDGLVAGRRYLLADGSEVDRNGERLPLRRTGVPADACWYVEDAMWRRGLRDAQDAGPVGASIGWDRSGRLCWAAYHPADPAVAPAYCRPDGGLVRRNPVVQAALCDDRSAVDELIGQGVHELPGTAVQAAAAGLAALAWRVLSEPADPTSPFGQVPEPAERPGYLPDDAVWCVGVGDDGGWVSAELDPITGRALGLSRTWQHGTGDLLVVRHADDGSQEIGWGYAGPQEDVPGLREVREHRDGRVWRITSFDRGLATHQEERPAPEELVLRRFHPGTDRMSGERRLLRGALVGEQWFDAEGRVVLEVRPEVDRAGEPVEVARAVLPDGATVVGRTGEGLDGGLLGRWTVTSPTGIAHQVDLAAWSHLRLTKAPDTAETVVALVTRHPAVLPASLAGIDGEDWSGLGGHRGASGEEMRLLVEGLSDPNPDVALAALQGLDGELLHEGRVPASVGTVLHYALRAAVAGDSPVAQDVEVLAAQCTTTGLHLADTAVTARALASCKALTTEAGAAKAADRLRQRIDTHLIGAYRAVAEHTDHWVRRAQDTGRPAVDRAVDVLLAALSTAVVGPGPLVGLVDVLRTEAGPDRGRVLAEAALDLTLLPPKVAARTAAPLLADSDPLVRFAAAATVLLSRQRRVPERAVALVRAATAGPAELDDYRLLALAMGTAASDAAELAALLPTGRAASR